MRSALVLLVIGLSHCTRIKFMNHCGHEVEVVRQDVGHAPEEQARLNPGESEMSEDFGAHEMSFRDGMHGGNTAEFNFNSWNNLDLYSLRVDRGYNTPMGISTNGIGGHAVHCRDHRCLEAYLFPTDALKTHGIQTGGMFTLTFCP